MRLRHGAGVECQWMNGEVMDAIHNRDKQYHVAVLTNDQTTWANYRNARNVVVSKIRIARNNYFLNNIDLNQNNPRILWKNLI